MSFSRFFNNPSVTKIRPNGSKWTEKMKLRHFVQKRKPGLEDQNILKKIEKKIILWKIAILGSDIICDENKKKWVFVKNDIFWTIFLRKKKILFCDLLWLYIYKPIVASVSFYDFGSRIFETDFRPNEWKVSKFMANPQIWTPCEE